MIAITGATGNTGSVAAKALLEKGEKVRAIGHHQHKLQPLVALGAESFVGNADDAASMTSAFKNADAVYLMIPPSMEAEDYRSYQNQISDAYAAAIKTSGVKYVVTLSSLGAQHPQGTGPIVGLHYLEQKLNAIPGLNVLHLRPGSFMQNLLRTIDPLRSMGTLPGAAPPDKSEPQIAARDIGAYAAKRLAARNFSGSSVQELLGPRDYTMREAAGIIGKAIGKPNLGYMQVPLPMLEQALVQSGFKKSMAALMIELFKGENAGLCDPEQPRSAESTTPTTMETFVAEEFLPAYRGQGATA
jgi:uncharacterized protein YbjT (DUF2867 family)